MDLGRRQPPFGPAGLDPRTGRAELAARARAIQEAAAYSARRSAGLLAGLLGVRFAEAVLTGGAARSALWPRILADVLGLPVRVPGSTESAAAGAAALAARALGLPAAAGFGDAAGAAADWVAQPAPARQRAYDQLYAGWRRASPQRPWPERDQ